MLLAVSALFIEVAKHHSAVADAMNSAIQSGDPTAIHEVAITLQLMTKTLIGFEPNSPGGDS